MPTDLPETSTRKNSSCSAPPNDPYISNCGFDTAGNLLNFLIPNINPGLSLNERVFNWEEKGTLQEFD
jgi:hypothetical protein